MGWLDYNVCYDSILRHVKSKGIRVYHRKLKGGISGLYDYSKVIISIDKKSRGKLDGCFYILHEYQHFLDHREGKFRAFFETKLEYTPENLQLIVDAELSASRGACKALRLWGVDYTSGDLSEGGLDEYIRFWKKYYFNRTS